jgi:Fe(3+) dicitrate transport protein
VFANLALLDAIFTNSKLPNQVGKIPAYAPRVLAKYGLAWRQDHRYDLSISATTVSAQYFQDSDASSGIGPNFVPALIPGYTVGNVALEWQISPSLRILGGVSNFTDLKYYSRVFQNGIEPARGRNFYLGLGLGF